MADGSSGLGGILFEAGKKQVQTTANAVAGQVTGNPKPLFGQKPQPLGGQFPKDPFAGMSEFGKTGFGPKKPAPLAPTPQFTQAQLDQMASENQKKDQEEIAKKQAELERIKQQHKQLHDEVYFDKIKNIGVEDNSLATTRKKKEEGEREEALAKQKEEQAKQAETPLAGSVLNPHGKQDNATLSNIQITSKPTGEALKTSG